MRAAARWCLAAALLWACAAPCALALFEDQAGTFDWYRAFMGHVRSAAFHPSKPRLYLSTEQGVVGSLSLRDGSIAWRQRLQDVPHAALLEGKAFLTLGGSMLRAWDHQRGSLLWEKQLSSQHRPSMALLPGAGPARVAVVAGGQIQVLSVADGSEKSSVALDGMDGSSAWHSHLAATEQGAAVAFAYMPGASKLVMYTAEDGSADAHTWTAPAPLSGTAAVGPHGFAALSADYSSICTAGPGLKSVDCKPLASLSPVVKPAHPDAPLQLTATPSGFMVSSAAQGASWALLLKVPATRGQGLELLAAFEDASAVSAPQSTPSGSVVVTVVTTHASGDVSLSYVDATTGSVLGGEAHVTGAGPARLAPGSTLPVVKAVIMGVFQMRGGNDGFRSLLVWSDERINLVQQGVVVWARDEGLAGVSSTIFADLPASKGVMADGAEEAVGTQSNFAQFLHMQLLSAKVQFQVAKPHEVEELTELRAALSDRNAPTRDSRGFRKLILATTTCGKVVALHNGDGHVVWARPFPPATAPQALLQWQLLHDLTHAPRVAALHSSPDVSRLAVLDAHTGAQLEVVEVQGQVDKVLSIGSVAVAEGVEQSVYLAVTLPTQPTALPVVQLVPDVPAARRLFASLYRTLYFWADNKAAYAAATTQDQPALQGYGFDAAAAAAVADGKRAPAMRTWSLAFAEPLLAVAAKDHKEPTHSSVKVLGDRSIKLRYLNPNTLVVVTGLAPGMPAQDETSMQSTIHIVDSASGLVLHHQAHPMTRGPAAAIITDNSAVVQLWDVAAAKFTINSLDLYDATARDFSVLDALFNPNATQPQSSFKPPPLEVLTASFFTPLPARSFRVTRTRAGITSKQFLALTASEQVHAFDPRFLDPRRPRHTKLTTEEIEERLIPYQDTLPINPMAFTTLNKQVLGLRGTITAPSRLESTSLVFTWGVDLQYTRVAPAKGFDTLDDDFSYGLLVAALVGLGTAAVAAHVYAKNSMLAAKWA